jgi:hypothetical protein
MNVEEAIAEGDHKEAFVTTPVPESGWAKLFSGLFIALMPILAFWATELFKPEWQNGEFSAYLILLLSPKASLLFFFLLAYSIVCYSLLLIDSVRYSQMYFVRFGVYTGALLAFHYSVLSGLFFFNSSSCPLLWSWILPLSLPKLYSIVVKKWNAELVNTILASLVVAIFLLSIILTKNIWFPAVFTLAVLTAAAPFWCLLIMLRAAIALFKSYEARLTLPRGLGLVAWIAGYVAAWRFDILKMYELYNALPPQPPPDCYIATAAAQGHPQFVGSWLVERANGETVQVNKQLQILKCAELACMAVQPHFHRTFRRVYDVVGKPLATSIRNPFWADLAYLLLKPWDMLARFVLGIIVPEIDLIASKMYMN